MNNLIGKRTADTITLQRLMLKTNTLVTALRARTVKMRYMTKKLAMIPVIQDVIKTPTSSLCSDHSRPCSSVAVQLVVLLAIGDNLK